MEDKYCYILDYSDSTVCKIILTEEDKELEVEQLANKYHLNYDDCVFMFSDKNMDEFIILNDLIED